jgi:hypothetical protein
VNVHVSVNVNVPEKGPHFLVKMPTGDEDIGYVSNNSAASSQGVRSRTGDATEGQEIRLFKQVVERGLRLALSFCLVVP